MGPPIHVTDAMLSSSLFLGFIALFAQDSAPLEDGGPSDSPRESLVTALDVTANGLWIAEGRMDGRVLVTDWARGELVREMEPPMAARPWTLAFDPRGRHLAGLDHGGILTVWDLSEDDPHPTWSAVVVEEMGEHEASFGRAFPGGVAVQWSADGAYVAASVHGGRRGIWSADGHPVRLWRSGPATHELVWMGNELLLATGSSLEGWKVEGLKAERVRKLVTPGPIYSFAVHPKGHMVLTGHEECQLRHWNLGSGELLHSSSFPDPFDTEDDEAVGAIAFSPGGDRVAFSTGASTFVRVLNLETHEVLYDSGFIGAHFGEEMPVVWSPDGSHLWFTFACGAGGLFCTVPEQGADRIELGDAFPPRFGAAAGVVNFDGHVGAVNFEGQRLR